jgi:hypothetical protein
MEQMNGFKVTEPQDVLNSLFNYRDNYHEKGVYLGFEKIDEFYSMQLGNCTDWTGFPMSGKTQVLGTTVKHLDLLRMEAFDLLPRRWK